MGWVEGGGSFGWDVMIGHGAVKEISLNLESPFSNLWVSAGAEISLPLKMPQMISQTSLYEPNTHGTNISYQNPALYPQAPITNTIYSSSIFSYRSFSHLTRRTHFFDPYLLSPKIPSLNT